MMVNENMWPIVKIRKPKKIHQQQECTDRPGLAHQIAEVRQDCLFINK
jgi:hypothetical protein